MKRLITCSDGTWNKPDTLDRGKPVKTNVEKMYNYICGLDTSAEPVRQLKIYDAGVGTGYSPKDRIFGGLTGSGIDQNIKDVYTFLMLNFEPGDELYLFGFSRGAYTARSLAGFIRNCGILKPQYLQHVDKAYELYRDRNKYTHPDSDLMRAFKQQYSNETNIKFIGVWDTVGSLGLPLIWLHTLNKERYSFHDQTLSNTVDNAYHALAIDDKRTLFSPTLWKKSKTVLKDPGHEQKLEQRWFTGVHSNIGGGYSDSGLSDLALQWLMDKAQLSGLCYDQALTKEIKPDYAGELRNSYTPMYRLWKAKYRDILLDDEDTEKKYNQEIDESVWKRFKKDNSYRPQNLIKYAKKEGLL